MLCAHCATDNREGRRFCAACGAALARPCPACGFGNEAGERFCGGCGARLEMVAAKPAEAPPPTSPPAAQELDERRQVTILFADLSGFTALVARRDPEETHRILARFFEAVDRTVVKYGGTIERHIGDNIMGVFGAPIAHDDDPYRAVEAALDIHRAVRGVGEDIGLPLSVHVGIASGTVMASNTGSSLKAGYGVIGNPVNLAARLQAQAKPGETLVSASVRAAVENRVELEALGEVAVKGLDAPVAVWRLVGERPTRGISVPLIGRHSELRLLRSLLDGPAGADQGRVVHVRGDAGIGKTRLIAAFADMARERGFSCHAALVLDFGAGQGRDAIRTLAASLLGLDAAAPEADRRAAATAAIDSEEVAGEDSVFLHDLLDLTPPSELRALFDAMEAAARRAGQQRVMAALVRAASERSPVLLVVEDIHWGDPATLASLAALSAAVDPHPVILAMTSRIVGDPVDAAWRARVRGGVATIDLGPLRREDAYEFGGRLRNANDAFLKRCIERADGNPLFLEQLLRNTEEGAEVDEVPASVQSLVLARMDRLPARDKAALQAASVAGQRFSLDLVRSLTGDTLFQPDVLLDHQMVRPQGAELLFAHALVRDGIYSSLTHERRRALHRAAAAWYGERDPALKAEHLERAEDAAAAQAYHDAAVAAAAASDYERALALAARGRAVAVTPADRCALDALRSEHLRETGHTLEALATAEASLAEAESDGERCRAHIAIAAVNRVLSRFEPTLQALAAAAPLATGEDRALERAQIDYYRGSVLFWQGDSAGCLAAHRAALAAATELGNPEWRARALSGIGDSFFAVCHMRSALEAFQSCVALCDEHGLGRVALLNRVMIAHCLVYQQRTAEALRILEGTRADAARIGNPHAELLATQSLGGVLSMQGHKDAQALLAKALSQARTVGARRHEWYNLSQQAELAFDEGRRADGRRWAEEGVALTHTLGLDFARSYALALLARSSEDPAERNQALAEGEDLLSEGGGGQNEFWFYNAAAECRLEDGLWAEARRCVRRMRACFADEPVPYVDFVADRIDVLCDVREGKRGGDLRLRLDRLIDEAASASYVHALPALRQARTAFDNAA